MRRLYFQLETMEERALPSETHRIGLLDPVFLKFGGGGGGEAPKAMLQI